MMCRIASSDYCFYSLSSALTIIHLCSAVVYHKESVDSKAQTLCCVNHADPFVLPHTKEKAVWPCKTSQYYNNERH